MERQSGETATGKTSNIIEKHVSVSSSLCPVVGLSVCMFVWVSWISRIFNTESRKAIPTTRSHYDYGKLRSVSQLCACVRETQRWFCMYVNPGASQSIPFSPWWRAGPKTCSCFVQNSLTGIKTPQWSTHRTLCVTEQLLENHMYCRCPLFDVGFFPPMHVHVTQNHS